MFDHISKKDFMCLDSVMTALVEPQLNPKIWHTTYGSED